MEILSPTTTYLTLATTLLTLLAFLLYQPTTLVRWLQKKNYQYEVTFALYMLTPTEKFVFNSILFLTTSLLALAITLYLPNHVITISRRGYYYFAGEAEAVAGAAATTLTENLSLAAAGGGGAGQDWGWSG
ncbi:hypothetical protein B0A50_07781 [Salinomyces thailandicus]|uniref:Uncharacterized protein n=1 Tax=Salinomyces thailandicus TaxID=706561 RepID=A0A4U0TL77_9PEZI|nr:hypothetical protein B0A50_07781 [Salinomyces thailandica]